MSDAPPFPFVCPICGIVSHNPMDAKHRYCARCHCFVDEGLCEGDGKYSKPIPKPADA